MPDGDIIHSGLLGIYQKPYQILCEGKLDRNECVWILMEAVLKDIKKQRADPIALCNQMGEYIAQVIKNSASNLFTDWTDLSKKIDRLAQQTNISNRTKSLVLDGAKDILHDLRYGQKIDVNTIKALVTERYMQKVYISNFKERIPLTDNHHANVDGVILAERIDALGSYISTQLSKWARKASVDEDVANLKRTRRSKVKGIDLDEDLL
jgi:hypothetical protein